MASGELSCQLRWPAQICAWAYSPQKAKKSLKAPFRHKTMLADEAAPHFPRAKTPYSASFSVPEGAGCWSRRSTLVGLAAPNSQKLSTAQQSYPQKIYENSSFP
jgi:hypothetical protein